MFIERKSRHESTFFKSEPQNNLNQEEINIRKYSFYAHMYGEDAAEEIMKNLMHLDNGAPKQENARTREYRRLFKL